MNSNPKILWTTICLSLTLTTPIFAQEMPTLSDEIKELQRFLGTWDTAAFARPAKLTPDGRQYTGRVHCESILDSQVIQGRGRFSRGDGTGSDTVLMWTYDKRKKTYELAQYASSGTFNRWTGQWDATSKTFTFKSLRDNGQMDTFTFRFKDFDTIQVIRELKDSDGTIYLFLDGGWTRKE